MEHEGSYTTCTRTGIFRFRTFSLNPLQNNGKGFDEEQGRYSRTEYERVESSEYPGSEIHFLIQKRGIHVLEDFSLHRYE